MLPDRKEQSALDRAVIFRERLKTLPFLVWIVVSKVSFTSTPRNCMKACWKEEEEGKGMLFKAVALCPPFVALTRHWIHAFALRCSKSKIRTGSFSMDVRNDWLIRLNLKHEGRIVRSSSYDPTIFQNHCYRCITDESNESDFLNEHIKNRTRRMW